MQCNIIEPSKEVNVAICNNLDELGGLYDK
jgi:hypothetical protein